MDSLLPINFHDTMESAMQFDIDTIRNTVENQTFDRKCVRIDEKALAVPIIAFANADGGVIAVGVENDGKVTGIDHALEHVNHLLRVPMDYCIPSVVVNVEYISCKNHLNEDDHVLLLHVEQSSLVHATTADEAYLRVGDRSRKLGFEERMQLTFAKGVQYFEDQPVVRAEIDDLDLEYVAEYCRLIGYQNNPMAYLRTNKNFLTEKNGREVLSGAAVLLFAKNPQQLFQRARVRVIRYEGSEELTGAQMNVVKDEIFEGRIVDMTHKVLEFVKTQIREHTFLGEGAVFRTIPDYPEFCWTEIIVNAIAHRDYSIMGTDIQVKIFSDHLTVESPGILPGRVRLDNMRQMHFSRNPKIVQVLHDYGFVREFGEGVDRICREMVDAGLPLPEFKQDSVMFRATIHKMADEQKKNDGLTGVATEKTTEKILHHIQENPSITMAELANMLHLTSDGIFFHISHMRKNGIIRRVGGRKNGYWEIIK